MTLMSPFEVKHEGRLRETFSLSKCACSPTIVVLSVRVPMIRKFGPVPAMDGRRRRRGSHGRLSFLSTLRVTP